MNDSVLADEDGDYSDWIEIYNGSTNTVDLDGWFLTDDFGNLDKWRIPSMVLSTGDYLVVFASNKDRNNPASELHTDFKLSGGGEYLALVESDHATVHHAYYPEYPSQVEDVSFGVSTNALGDLRYFATPTPNAQNGGDYLGFVKDTKFSVDRGFYSNTFVVAITSDTAGATIHYTTDFSEPDEISGTVYSGPVTVSNTTCLRALAFLPGWRSTDVDTHTYVFLDEIVQQPSNPSGFPSTWKSTTADYEMDPDIVTDPTYGPMLEESLTSIPTVSFVTETDDMFDSSSGIYPNSGGRGETWERPVSVEWFTPDGSEEFQINCGVRIYGGAFRSMGLTRKKSFRLLFKGMYGPTKLNFPMFPWDDDAATSYDNLVLRGGANDGWNNWGDADTQYVIDEYMRRTQLAFGRPVGHGRVVHLYLNGLYWGIYNIIERPEASFCAEYFGGDKDGWDALNAGSPTGESNTGSWNDMLTQVRGGMTNNADYQKLQGNNPDRTPNPAYDDLMDVPNYIDYMFCNFWGGTGDWPGHNYYCACRRPPDATGWKWFSWDAEGAICVWSSLTSDRTGVNNGAGEPYKFLRENKEFQLQFADQAHRHMFNGGAVTTNEAYLRYKDLTDEVEMSIVAESARWGDQRGGTPYTLADWQSKRDYVLDTYMPQRTAIVLGQLRGADLYPDTDAPIFSIDGSHQHGGSVTNGALLTMTNSALDTIYYTLDGTDPREYGTGTATGTLYAGAVPLTITSLVKSRALSAGDWSALNEAVFAVAGTSTLSVTEIMYNPREPSGSETNSAGDAEDFEFLELKNTGTGTVGLAGLHFTNGISFDFTYGNVLTLTQGEYVVVVENTDAFTNRYGSGMLIAGEYSGSLDNAGERLTLCDVVDTQLVSFSYNDSRSWPLAADGAGHSLVPQAEGSPDPGYGGSWRSSAYIDGSPGEADPEPVRDVVLNEIAAHTDYTNAAKPEYDSNDWLELYNTKSSGVSLANWYLSDSAGDLKKWAIPATNTIAPEAWKAFDEVTGFHSPITNGFGLDKSGEQVFLSYLPGTSEDRVADCVSFKGQENGATLGRYTDGDDYWYTLAPTRASANGAPGSHVVISEIMYHPAPTVANPENNTNDEYVKIYNPLFVPVELWTTAGVWRIDGGIGYRFPSNTTIAAKDELVLVSFDPVTNITARNEFLAHYDLDIGDVTFLGPYSEQLDNQSDRVALEKPIEPDPPDINVSWVIVDEVIYYDSAPWPTTPDGTGPPLYRTDLEGAGNDASSWTTDPPGSDKFVINDLSISGGSPLVAWEGLTNGEWYVERSTNLSGGFTRIATTTVTTVYHDTALPAPVTECYYRIAVTVAAVPVYTRNTAGYFQLTLPSNGYSLVSMPYQKFPLYRGTVSSNTTLTITDDDASWTAGEFAHGAAGQEPAGTNSFYVEIRDKGSAFEGKMFPIATNSATELQIEGGVAAGLTTDVLARAS
ncbi:MAG: lamin tail domain-containing protein, partial [Kiritimatiellia bacterium]|nr:lamin tail domain-containing protein [Kiritimatiellia bacterium]